MRLLRLPLLPLLVLASIATASPAIAAASGVECGVFRNYIAPDPIGPTPGSIRFGLSEASETIAADATLVPPADSQLPILVGGPPTCLLVTRSGGVITALQFAASGTLAGTVILVPNLLGSGQGRLRVR